MSKCWFFNKFFIETVHSFKKEIEETIIPEWLFEERKTFIARLSILICKQEI